METQRRTNCIASFSVPVDSPSFNALYECLCHGAIHQPLSRCCNYVNETMMSDVGVDGCTCCGVGMALSFGRLFCFVAVALENASFSHLFLLFEERLSEGRAHRSILT